MEKSVLIKGDNYDISGIFSYTGNGRQDASSYPVSWNRSTEE